ncbi:ParB/RepB/Spo0J family partition protein [Sporosarcina sp. UB5]|uniref:ParB/RepB/Spo0J family partition protein n=1 Tax=Sporosarcina sp. UB5 TaxID=3047463 RepID=UPI003D790C29
MTKQMKEVKLSQIELETSFRNKEKDLSLELDINRNGLKTPLVVEEKSADKYVLVDGYRRYYALDFLGKEVAECIIEPFTSEEERIIKRLGKELHTKRRTAYQLEKMINRLLENEAYDAKLIASLCNVSTETIAKYIRGSDVNPEWLRRGEKANVGRHAFTDIHNLDVNDDTKDHIVDRYIGKEINKSVVDVIKKSTKEKAFTNLPEEKTKECIDEIIEKKSQEYDAIREVVHKNSLEAKYNKYSHTFMHNVNLRSLTKIEKILGNNNYINFLSNEQRMELNNLARKILLRLNPPITWLNFPNDVQFYEKHAEKNVKNLRNKVFRPSRKKYVINRKM